MHDTSPSSTVRLLQRSSNDTNSVEMSDWTDWSDSLEEEKIRARPSRWSRYRWGKFRRKWMRRFDYENLTTRPFGVRIRRRLPSKVRPLILLFNFAVFFVVATAMISVLDAVFHPSYANPPAHYTLLEEAVRSSSYAGRGNVRSEKIFIASNMINPDLIRAEWGKALLQLITYLGPNNVFLSIYENDSGPETAAALHEFAEKLSCEYSIVTGDHLPLSSFPSVIVPTGEARVKRLTYLEEVRNRLLWPLDDPASHPDSRANFTSIKFDKILFVNDVYFKPIEALHLLFSTHFNTKTNAADYRAACAVDFISPITHYDSFVVRDTNGHETGSPLFPWFKPDGDAKSRNAVKAESDAVPVKSCWGGMVSYDAEEFLRPEVRQGTLDGEDNSHARINAQAIYPRSRSTPNDNPALRFRHQPEMFWEESECCLLNADLAYRYKDPANPKIYLNPYVRVAYKSAIWSSLPLARRVERVWISLQYLLSRLFYAEYNPRREQEPSSRTPQTRWVYDDKAMNGEAMRNLSLIIPAERLKGEWKQVSLPAEPGGFCGQRRTFLMLRDLEKANSGRSGKNWEKGPWPGQRPAWSYHNEANLKGA